MSDIKIPIYAPTFHQAAELAVTMNLYLNQWDWSQHTYVATDVQVLFYRIEELEG